MNKNNSCGPTNVQTLAEGLSVSDEAMLCCVVYVNFGFSQDTPLFKKYAVMNSGLIDAARYNDTIVQSIGDIKVRFAVLSRCPPPASQMAAQWVHPCCLKVACSGCRTVQFILMQDLPLPGICRLAMYIPNIALTPSTYTAIWHATICMCNAGFRTGG